jgi:hypothetical protein
MENILKKYLLLAALTVLIPPLLMIVIIMLTGDRITGMKVATLPGMLVPHLIFGMILIDGSWWKKIGITILTTGIIYGILVIIILNNVYIKTSLDIYGSWDLRINNLLVGLVCWESCRQILRVTRKKGMPYS